MTVEVLAIQAVFLLPLVSSQFAVAMPNDNYQRDQLWSSVYDTYYYVYFDELLGDTLLVWWSRFDDWSRALIALSASSSAVAGWGLWKHPEFKIVWAVIAGAGVMIAILHTPFGVTHRVRDLMESKGKLLALRLDLQTFRMKMTIDPEFPIQQFQTEFLEFRERWGTDCLKRVDPLVSKWLRRRVQDYLDVQLKQYDETNTRQQHN